MELRLTQPMHFDRLDLPLQVNSLFIVHVGERGIAEEAESSTESVTHVG